ncbi:MAG: glycoside hydrolase, partial [Verrucomicrobiota bacterium]|nr:glycoside hydrolase [Verrucomicrobiota bacterium]
MTTILSPASGFWLLTSGFWLLASGIARSAETPWWNDDFKRRAVVELPAGAAGAVRLELPAGAKPGEVRVVAGNEPLEHWAQTLELSAVRVMTPDPKEHARFPRLLAAGNGDLLLTYRVGQAHAASDSRIVQRISKDKGRTWSPEQTICEFEKGVSAQNVIMLAAPSGRIIGWVSRYEFKNKGRERVHQVWSWSDDHGATWAPWTRFDPSNERSSYYMTDAIALADGGLLAIDAAFPPTGGGNCFAQVWRSDDGGKAWKVIGRLTEPAENLGDEVGLLETRPGEVLCLLRDRRGKT